MEEKKRKAGRPVGSKPKSKAERQKELANRGKPTDHQLTDNQLRAAWLWVYGKDDGTPVSSKNELSKLVGVSYTVLLGYFGKEWFLAEVDRLQKEQARENKQMVARYAPEAIDTLVSCMRDVDAAMRERINAAKTILDMAGMNDKTINVNVGGEVGVVRGGFGRDVLEEATQAIEVQYEVVDDEEEVSVSELL